MCCSHSCLSLCLCLSPCDLHSLVSESLVVLCRQAPGTVGTLMKMMSRTRIETAMRRMSGTGTIQSRQRCVAAAALLAYSGKPHMPCVLPIASTVHACKAGWQSHGNHNGCSCRGPGVQGSFPCPANRQVQIWGVSKWQAHCTGQRL